MAKKEGRGGEREEDRSSNQKIKSIDLNAILIAEIEKIVTSLENEGSELDHTLLTFLDGHVVRYINMLKIVRKVGEDTPEFISARNLSERIAKMLGRAIDIVPPNEQTETIKRFIEAEDNELFTKHMDELKTENEQLRKFIEQEDRDILKKQIQTLEMEREELKRTIDSLSVKRDLIPSTSLESMAVTEGPAAEAVAQIKTEVEIRMKADYEKMLDDTRREADSYKNKVKVIATKFRDLQAENASLSAMMSSMQTEKLRLTQEISQWRQKFNLWQESMNETVEKRARLMVNGERTRLNETLASLKQKERLLSRIEGVYEIVQDRDGENCLVIPKTVSQNLPKNSSQRIKMEVRGTSVSYTKT